MRRHEGSHFPVPTDSCISVTTVVLMDVSQLYGATCGRHMVRQSRIPGLKLCGHVGSVVKRKSCETYGTAATYDDTCVVMCRLP